MNHANIVKVVAFSDHSDWVKDPLQPSIPVAYVALELVENGELFDYIAMLRGEPLSERICRFYFKQLLSAIHHMHTNGIAHRDLKLENILLD